MTNARAIIAAGRARLGERARAPESDSAARFRIILLAMTPPGVKDRGPTRDG